MARPTRVANRQAASGEATLVREPQPLKKVDALEPRWPMLGVA